MLAIFKRFPLLVNSISKSLLEKHSMICEHEFLTLFKKNVTTVLSTTIIWNKILLWLTEYESLAVLETIAYSIVLCLLCKFNHCICPVSPVTRSSQWVMKSEGVRRLTKANLMISMVTNRDMGMVYENRILHNHIYQTEKLGLGLCHVTPWLRIPWERGVLTRTIWIFKPPWMQVQKSLALCTRILVTLNNIKAWDTESVQAFKPYQSIAQIISRCHINLVERDARQ